MHQSSIIINKSEQGEMYYLRCAVCIPDILKITDFFIRPLFTYKMHKIPSVDKEVLSLAASQLLTDIYTYMHMFMCVCMHIYV